MVNRLKLIFTFIAITTFTLLSAQDIPERPIPERLVNDFSGILSSEENQALEQKLILFNDSTSTQIAVVIVNSLNGYDKSDFAYQIGEKWGVGQKGKNNGVVILLKPKTANERGEVNIAPGYGLEATLTDALCKRIVEKEMIPAFKQNNYYTGIDNAVNAIISVTKGEYKSDPKAAKNGWMQTLLIFGVIIVIVLLTSSKNKGNNKNNHTIGKSASSVPWWLIGTGLGSSSGWGGSSGSSGGSSFGGFGGGSFGGGGSGGSW